jgi:Copper amine oxidase N-terminal domain
MLASVVAVAAVAGAQVVAVSINGAPVTFTPAPIERAGRVYVPLRGVFERLGASVVYENGVINANANGRQIALRIGSNLASVNGVAQAVDVAPFVIEDRTYVPLRFVSQALGATVSYNAQDRGITISAPQAQLANAAPAGPPVPKLAAGTRFSGTISTDINTATAQVGDRFAMNLTAPYPNDDASFAGAYVSGHVASVQKAGQGTPAQLGLAFDKIVFPDGRTEPLAAEVVSLDQKHPSAIPQQALGALGGMLVGNAIAKTVFGASGGGIIGAAGGFLYANNMKTNFTVPKSSTVTVEVEVPRRQSTDADPNAPPQAPRRNRQQQQQPNPQYPPDQAPPDGNPQYPPQQNPPQQNPQYPQNAPPPPPQPGQQPQ